MESVLTRLPRVAAATADWLADLLAQNDTRGIYVPPGFARGVVIHLVANLDRSTRSTAPLILAVTGPFGCGKTVTLHETLHRLGVHTEVLPASGFESRWANVPVERIHQAYENAAERQTKDGQPAAVVIDDIDTAIGLFHQFAVGTTNTQHCIAAFMELADKPTNVNGKYTDRVPIFMTCNDLTKLYGALRRPGRLRGFAWNPTGLERQAIVQHVLRSWLTAEQLTWLLRETHTWTLAHFGQLKAILQEAAIERAYQHIPAQQLLRSLLRQAPAASASEEIEQVSDAELRRAVKSVQREESAKVDYTEQGGVEMSE